MERRPVDEQVHQVALRLPLHLSLVSDRLSPLSLALVALYIGVEPAGLCALLLR